MPKLDKNVTSIWKIPFLLLNGLVVLIEYILLVVLFIALYCVL